MCWLAQSALPADTSAQQSAPLTCPIGTIYQIQRASSGSTTGRLNVVNVSAMSGTNPVTATQVTPSLIPATSPGANALGISAGGVAAWALAPQSPGGTGDTLTFTLRKFDPATDAWTSHTVDINTAGRLPSGVTAAGIRSQGIVAGAIDPHSGDFFWAYLASAPVNRMVVFGFNTTTNQPIGVVANSTLPQETPASGGSNGDIAFDGAGNLFVVSNTGTNAAVGVIQGPLPTSESQTPTLVNTRLTTFANPQSNSYNGIAFNSIGELFIQWSAGDSTFIRKISPQNGASIAGPAEVDFTSPGGGIGVDLGCNAAPPTMQLRKSVDARRTDTDQFHLSITGGDLTEGNTATTSGTETGVQAETAGPVVARAGTTYTFTETGAGTTNLDNYGTEWRCVNQAAGNGEVAAGTGTTFTLAPGAGEAILCTFTNHYHAVPNIAVVKTGVLATGANGVANPGDTIHYTITVRNTGTVTLRNVTVTERDLAGLSAIDCGGGTHVIATLGVGDERECTATYQITQADIDLGYVPNFATATGTPPQGPDVTDGDGEQVPIPAAPGINVDKTGVLDTGADGVANAGDTIHYTITVHNTGNVTLRNVTVTERDLHGLSAIVCPGGTHVIATLAVGESVNCTATYAVTPADVDHGYVPNFATATGTPPHGPDVTDGDDAVVPITPAPGINVVKTGVLNTGANGVANPGDTINYTITVHNTGNVTLSNVTVTDTLLSAIDCGGGTHVIATLAVGNSVDCTATYAVTPADIDAGFVPNFATATGTPPHGPDVTDGDEETVPITAHPALNVVKTGVLHTGANGVANVGDTIHYTIAVRNTGNVTLSNVTVTDTLLSAIDCGGGNHVIATLRVGESVHCTATYAVTPADIDAGFVPNFATATGTPPHGPDVTDGDEETVPIRAVPGLNVVKTGVLHTGANGVANVGDTIHYTIAVRNTGNVTLSSVTVTERDLHGLSAIDCGGGNHVIATLRVGESVHCTATYKVTQADIDAGFVPNFATATGTPPHGPDVTDGDDAVVPVTAVPGLDVVKTGVLNNGANGVAGVGDTIHYTITVRNSGNVTLHNVRVTEHNLAGLSAIHCGGGTNVIDDSQGGRIGAVHREL